MKARATLLGTLLALASSALACDEPALPNELREDLERAHAAYADTDVDGFVLDMGSASAHLECIDRRIPVDLAANYHRMLAVQLFLAGDRESGSDAALHAAAALQPTFGFKGLFPEGHQFLVRFDELKLAPARTERIARPKAGFFAFDGNIGRDRPIDRASVVQRIDADGQVQLTTYLQPGTPLPDYDVRPVVRHGLLAGGVATALASLTTGAIAMGAERRFKSDDPATRSGLTRSDLNTLQARANTMSTATALLAGTSAGLFGAALVVKR